MAWFGATLIGIVNGSLRRAVYEDRAGRMGAHYISTAILLVLLGAYMALLARRWPIPTRRAALSIGATWTALTVVFEFGFGRYAAGEPWSKLVEQYDLSRGYVWLAIPLWTAVGPTAIRRLVRSSQHHYQEHGVGL
jgi:hypothetical protein